MSIRRLSLSALVAATSASLFVLMLASPSGAQFDYANQTSVVLEDPGTGATAALTVQSATYGWDTLEIRTTPTTQTRNYDRIRVTLPGSQLGPGAIVRLIDPSTGQTLVSSGGLTQGAGTGELVLAISGTLRQEFVVEVTAEAFIPSAPTTTTVVRTSIVTTSAAPTTTEAPTTTSTTTTTTVDSLALVDEPSTTVAPASPDPTEDQDDDDAASDNEGAAANDQNDNGGSRSTSLPASPSAVIAALVAMSFIAGFLLLRSSRLRETARSAAEKLHILTPPAIPASALLTGNEEAESAAPAPWDQESSADARLLAPPPVPPDSDESSTAA